VNDLPTLRDVLIIAGAALVVYLVLVACARVLRRSRRLRFGVTFHLFAAIAGLLAGVNLSAWRTPLSADVVRHLAALAVVVAAFPLVEIINRLCWRPAGPEGQRGAAPRVLVDLTGIVVVVAAVLAVLQFFYHVTVPGLLAGSGVIAIVVGLALQDLLGNLVAGISLYFEKNFQTGDWLLIHDTHAKVIEISWRSTRLLTTDDVLIDVPNSDIVKQTVTNFELPTPRHAVRATIGLHYDVPPVRAQAVLRDAAAIVPGVCADPAPVVYVKDYADSAIVYEIKVWIDDHGLMARVLSQVRANCWYAVRRAGMEIPYPQLTLHRGRRADDGAIARATAAAALRRHAVFGCLSAEQIEAIVRGSPVVLFATTEHLIEQGAPGDSMFLLVRGRVEVRLRREGQTTVVAQLGAGDCLGEMSLLTGDPRTATVVAVAEVEALEIRSAVFAEQVHAHPEVLAKLSDLLAQRQLANDQHLAQGEFARRIEQTRVGLLKKFRGFFQLGG
jgi:small-conductance mechanosensitive channel/CRP-like cAMP-binding protein